MIWNTRHLAENVLSTALKKMATSYSYLIFTWLKQFEGIVSVRGFFLLTSPVEGILFFLKVCDGQHFLMRNFVERRLTDWLTDWEFGLCNASASLFSDQNSVYKCRLPSGCRDNVVGVVTVLQPGRPINRVWYRVGARGFCVLRVLSQTWGPTHIQCYKGPFHRSTVAGTWSWPLTSIWCRE